MTLMVTAIAIVGNETFKGEREYITDDCIGEAVGDVAKQVLDLTGSPCFTCLVNIWEG